MATSPRHGGWRKRGAIDWTGDVCRRFGEGHGRGEGVLMGKCSACADAGPFCLWNYSFSNRVGGSRLMGLLTVGVGLIW